MNTLSARDLRMTLAKHDIPPVQFAREAGIAPQTFSNVLHEKTNAGDLLRLRIERTLERVEAGEITRQSKPRGRHGARRVASVALVPNIRTL